MPIINALFVTALNPELPVASASRVPWGMNALNGFAGGCPVLAADQVRCGGQVRVRAGYLPCARATRLIPYIRSCRLLAGNAEET